MEIIVRKIKIWKHEHKDNKIKSIARSVLNQDRILGNNNKRLHGKHETKKNVKMTKNIKDETLTDFM